MQEIQKYLMMKINELNLAKTFTGEVILYAHRYVNSQ